MSNFALDRMCGKPTVEQWRDFLHADESRTANAIDRSAAMARNTAIIQGVGALIMHENMLRAVDNASRNVTSALARTEAKIEWGANITVAAIDELRQDSAMFFNYVTAGLNAVVDSVDRVHVAILKLTALLDYRTQVIIDKLTLTNKLLENISSQLMIPDFQKERVYFIQQGLKHYRNATRNSELNRDALDNLLRAEEREATDCLVLYYIGMIYLYGKGVSDPGLAEGYFLRAAKYAAAEGRDSTTAVSRQLDSFVANEELSEEEARNYRKRRARQLSRSAWIEASVTAYAQGNIDDATRHAKRACELDRTDARAGLQYLKTLCAGGDLIKAHSLLRRLLDHSLLLAIPMVADLDIANAGGIAAIFCEYRDNEAQRVNAAIDALLADHGTQLEADQELGPMLAAVRRNVGENTLYSMAIAADELSTLTLALQAWNIRKRRLAKEHERQLVTYRKWLEQFEAWNDLVDDDYPYAADIRRHTGVLRSVVANPTSLDGDALREAYTFMMRNPTVDLSPFRALFDADDQDLGPSMVPDMALMNVTGAPTPLDRVAWMRKVSHALSRPATTMTHVEAYKIMSLLSARVQGARDKLYEEGKRELAAQDKKWFRKDYAHGLTLLRRAHRLGHVQAATVLNRYRHREPA
jgi:hypothetical protein